MKTADITVKDIWFFLGSGFRVPGSGFQVLGFRNVTSEPCYFQCPLEG